VNTTPNIDQLLEGVLISLGTDVLPYVSNPKAAATVQMMQSILQGVRQVLPVVDQRLAEEHNAMLHVIAEITALLGGCDEVAAERIRERAAMIGAEPELPIPLPREVVADAHRAVGNALTATMIDLDELQRAGVAAADDGLAVLRAHVGPRVVRDTHTILVGNALLGRG
jgi:hypothetical protein